MMRIVWGGAVCAGAGGLASHQRGRSRDYGEAAASAARTKGDISEDRGMIDFRDVDQRDALARFVFGIKIGTAVVLRGEKARHRAVRCSNVAYNFNFVFWRGFLGLLVPGVRSGRECGQRGQNGEEGKSKGPDEHVSFLASEASICALSFSDIFVKLKSEIVQGFVSCKWAEWKI